MPKKTRKGTNGSKRRSKKNPIVSDLQNLEEKARDSGYQLVAHLIGVAALAARDERPRRSSTASD